MKKLIFAATVLAYCLLVSISSNAQEGIDVPQPVKESFTGQFKNSDYQRWVKLHDMYVATFSVGGTWKDAYFGEDGEFKGVGKFITLDLLPVFAMQSINEKYPDYEVFELYQYECLENGICFYAVLKNDKHEMMIKMSSNGEVTYSQRSKIKGTKVAGTDIAVK